MENHDINPPAEERDPYGRDEDDDYDPDFAPDDNDESLERAEIRDRLDEGVSDDAPF